MDKRRVLIVVLVAVVALALIGGVLLLSTGGGGDRAATTTSRVLVANQDIPVGTAGSAVQTLVTPATVPAAQAEMGAISDPSQIASLTVTVAVKAGEQLTRAAFAGSASGSPSPAGTAMPSGTVSLYLSMSGVQAASGNLRAGQRISIFVTMTSKAGVVTTQRSFSHVPVLSVSSQTSVGSGVATSAPTSSAAASAAPATPAPSASRTVTQPVTQVNTSTLMALALSPDDGARLITAFKTGQLWLAVEDANSPGGYGQAITPDGVFQ